MTLHPELRAVVDMVHGQPAPPAAEQGAPALRDAFAALAGMLGQGDTTVDARDLVLCSRADATDLSARCYTPAQVRTDVVVLWLHGGGWVIGSVDTHDAQCRDLAAATGARVVAPEYRLAPEHPFPAAIDDAEASVRRVARHGVDGVGVARLVLGGDSAGANLAAGVARRLRDDPEPGLQAVLMALVYPVTDPGGLEEHESMRTNGEGYLLTADTMAFFVDSYLPDPSTRNDPDASPLRVPDLSGLPPALVLTAEYDPLRDEGDAYAAALAAAGVPVAHECLQGVTHLAFQLRGTEPARMMLERVAEAVRSVS